ncbi:hypothetical protein WAI453_002668 [Rhynchosporium graminicola]
MESAEHTGVSGLVNGLVGTAYGSGKMTEAIALYGKAISSQEKEITTWSERTVHAQIDIIVRQFMSRSTFVGGRVNLGALDPETMNALHRLAQWKRDSTPRARNFIDPPFSSAEQKPNSTKGECAGPSLT